MGLIAKPPVLAKQCPNAPRAARFRARREPFAADDGKREWRENHAMGLRVFPLNTPRIA
jgi:hypothetical protein